MSRTELHDPDIALHSGCDGEIKRPPRERILNSASELFRTHGIGAVGVEIIAELANSNKMTLYRHFGSKEELLCACLRMHAEKTTEIWQSLEDRYPGDAAKQLRAWVEEVTDVVFSDNSACLLANVAVEQKDPNHGIHRIIADAKEAYRVKLTDLCRRAGVAEAEQLADALTLLFEGARIISQSAGPDGPHQKLKQSCLAMINAFSR
ncbi:transcriptional regulator, TetR family [Mesorhizobium albiziae]|uniref:Transcriptional regulator, TetR family n=2 Tax=Neomesorhizobium albiziae TaxID=335020 RepID=A0A1I4CS12_9HYPH|nr:TetR family transcriptional regulator [Mesorhizobium albiziae]SFK84042.1 transcriptional regulator, TetR family [Mesorhizobium albiziae]